jgi:hypothetical protein
MPAKIWTVKSNATRKAKQLATQFDGVEFTVAPEGAGFVIAAKGVSGAAMATVLTDQGVRVEAAKAAKPAKPAKAPKAAKPANGEAKSPKTGTKSETAIAMLKSKDGATVKEIMAALNWCNHTVRGFMSTARSKLGLTIEATKVENRGNVFRIS